MDIKEYQRYGEELESLLKVRTFPVAIKWFEKESDVPEDAISPMKDFGKHFSFCQAVAASRMKGWTMAMTIKDHWCWNPLIGFGCVECEPGSESFDAVTDVIFIPDKNKAEKFFSEFPRLPLGKYEAVVTAPLAKVSFEPDVVLVYGDTEQINFLTLMAKSVTGKRVSAEHDGIDSCIYSTVKPFQTNEYTVVFPDIGERERAQARTDEMIFASPAAKIAAVTDSLRETMDMGIGLSARNVELAFDHSRPPFYNDMFRMWGLEEGIDRR